MAVINPSYRTIKEKLESIILKVINENSSGYLQTSDVKNNLTSTDTNKPLSALQGKELKALIDNKEDKIYRIVGTEVSSPSSSSARLHCGTLPFDSSSGKIIVYVVPNISTLSESQKAIIYGSYPSGGTTSTNIKKSNNEDLTIGEIQTGDELLLMMDGNWKLISNSSISDKENSSNKVSSWNSTTNNIRYPTEKLVKDSLDGKEDILNKVTSISSSSTDTQYPSAKCVYDELTLKVNDKTRATSTFSPQDYEDESSSQCTWENPYKVTIDNSGYLILDFTSMLDEIDDIVYFNIVTNNTINVVYNDVSIYTSSDTKSLYIKKRSSDSFTLYLFNSDNFTSLQTTYSNSTPTIRIAPTTSNSTTVNFGNKMWYHYMHFIDRVYPIGSIYMSVNSVNPQYIIGGTWEQIEDRFLLASGQTYSPGTTGGEATHTLTTSEMPSHTHTQNQHRHQQYGNYSSGSGSGSGYMYSTNRTITNVNTDYTTATNQNTGGGQAHNNMPPYLTVYMWKRTA